MTARTGGDFIVSLRDQAAEPMTQYPTDSHYYGPEATAELVGRGSNSGHIREKIEKIYIIRLLIIKKN